ncbi:MAG: type II methionyl aminopeptidase [Candidatus Hadarchaeales archaeon]
MEPNEIELYRKAGKIAAQVRERLRAEVKPGVKILDIAKRAEDIIRELGAQPAFPANISLNEVAAHYSPPPWDETVIKEGDVVKVDIGVQVDGYIGDTAFTVGDERLVSAAERALEEAVRATRPGVDVGEIGAAVERVARGSNLKPIQNLTGHSLGRWELHAGLSIPNVGGETGQKLEVGQVLAIEPFVTEGAGFVEEDERRIYIYSFLRESPIRSRMARELLREIKKRYPTLPFSIRWLAEGMSRLRLEITLRELRAAGAIRPYHVLVERAKGRVAQAEHTVIVTENGCEITTLT